MTRASRGFLGIAVLALLILAPACDGAGAEDREITVYSGRGEELIGPVLERFSEDTGIDVAVKYGSTAELAATLLEEGDQTPADVYIAQDAGALGAVQDAGMFTEIDDELLERVNPAYQSEVGQWVGVSGRARVIVYNTEALSPEELPDSILDFTDSEWQGRLGWAPTNGSFQAWVTALRLTEGEDAAREWLEGIQANEPQLYPNNSSIVDAAGRGEIDAGFVNHYYLYRFLAEEGEDFAARNYYTAPGDVGTLVNVAGAGILAASDQEDLSQEFIDYLLGEEAQTYLSDTNAEYPLIDGVETSHDLPSISEIEPVELDLSNLEDLEGTLELLREVDVLP